MITTSDTATVDCSLVEFILLRTNSRNVKLQTKVFDSYLISNS